MAPNFSFLNGRDEGRKLTTRINLLFWRLSKDQGRDIDYYISKLWTSLVSFIYFILFTIIKIRPSLFFLILLLFYLIALIISKIFYQKLLYIWCFNPTNYTYVVVFTNIYCLLKVQS